MPTKSDLQDSLKAKYGINKNITQSLSAAECEELLTLLQSQPSAIKLVGSFIAKNEELSRNNRTFGQQRSQTQQKFKSLQTEHEKLEKEIAELENSNTSLVAHRARLVKEQQELEAQIQQLSSKVQNLTTHNDELLDANAKLQKDNKDLKTIVDQIRLRLARDTQMLLEYEDSEIRKALIRLFRWTLG